jgi:hypothetical protein
VDGRGAPLINSDCDTNDLPADSEKKILSITAGKPHRHSVSGSLSRYCKVGTRYAMESTVHILRR